MMDVLTSADRKPATNDAESAALLRTMIAYTGRYIIDGDKFVTMPDVSWNEVYTAHEQVRYYKIDGDKLFLRTAEQPSGVLVGKRVVATIEFVRD